LVNDTGTAKSKNGQKDKSPALSIAKALVAITEGHEEISDDEDS
jgi:hypothetical protein